MIFSQNQIDKIISIAFDAGKIASEAQKSRNFTITKKPDNTDVTSADIAISKFLNQKLSQEFQQIPIICEEGELRQTNSKTFWLIDPIDGTSSFIKGSDNFAINIALIKDEEPIFGLIYAPNFCGGKMAVTNADKKVSIIDNSNKIRHLEQNNLSKNKQDHNQQKPFRIITSNRTQNIEIENFVKQIHPQIAQNFTIFHMASAVKFLQILEDEADLYISFRKLMEWDTAAGQALIEHNGGILKSLTLQDSLYVIGSNMLYNKPNFVNQFFACYKTL